jgi:zinc transport system substrate-binding protein
LVIILKTDSRRESMNIPKIVILSIVTTVTILAKIDAIVSIVPEKSILDSIGKDSVNTTVMVLPGNSPHSYEPKPSQMRAVSKADIYLSIGVEFEKAWLPRFKSQNRDMKIYDISSGIERYPIGNAKGGHPDPHIWTSPTNIEKMAENCKSALCETEPDRCDEYGKNLTDFKKSVESTRRRIEEILSGAAKRKFMVFHPSWGYFAREFGLEQIAIERGGKNPGPRELTEIVKKARAEKISTIVVQPEFSDKSARILASELGIPVIPLSPLSPDWRSTLLKLSKAIAGVEE